MIDAWRSRPFYPHDLPQPWKHAGVSTIDEDWYPFVQRTPRADTSLALLLERSGHCYGTVVPLMECGPQTYFHCGGLLFAYLDEEFVIALPPSMTVRDILALQDWPPTRDVKFDRIATAWANASHTMWQWERRIVGRNRWEEMRQRGGDVSTSLVEDLPEAWPIRWFGVFGDETPEEQDFTSD